MKHGTLITKHLGLGVSKKYLFPTTGNMNILTPPLPLETLKCSTTMLTEFQSC